MPTLAERIKHTTANFIIRASLRDDYPDHVHTALQRHQEGQRGQGKWITKIAATLHDLGVTWNEVRAAAVPRETHTNPPWRQQPHTTISSLRRKKQDIVKAELRQYRLQSIHEAANDQTAITTIYYTDRSAEPQGGKAGAAFVCTVNSRDTAAAVVPTNADTTTTITSATRGNVVIAMTTAKAVNTTTAALLDTDFSSFTQTELVAIKMALEHVHTSHNHNVLINTDSMTAIASLNKK